MTRTLLTAAAALFATAATAAEPFEPEAVRNYRQAVGGVANMPTGQLVFENNPPPNGPAAVTLVVFHADSLRPFAEYRVPQPGKGSLMFQERPLVVGMDFGVELAFPNGARSRTWMLRDVAARQGGDIVVRTTDVWNGTAPPQPVPLPPSVAFPVRASKTDVLMPHCDMVTNVVLSNIGRLDGVTRLSCGRKFDGFTGGVMVSVTDSAGNVLWQSDVRSYGIDGALPLGPTQTQDVTFTDIVPPAVLAQARAVAVVQLHTPKPPIYMREEFQDAMRAAAKVAAEAAVAALLAP